MLENVDVWVRRPSEEKSAWIYGHAGSGKSALLNSIAENLEIAGIPFTCFLCKRDDPELSNIHRVLTTVSHCFAEYYGDYCGFISDLVNQSSGRSVLTGDVRKQSELLFGKMYDLVSPKGAHRPPIHVILIDALDECQNHRDQGRTAHERRVLLQFFLGLANAVPWIKVLITSRPEPDIVDVFKDITFPLHRINIDDEVWKTSADIRFFIESQSEELKLGLSSDRIDRFQDKASGLFIWCTTVFRFIKESCERWDIIDNILEDQRLSREDNPHAPLYSLYYRVLSSAVSRAQDKELMEWILSIIFVAATRQPLSAMAIADILYPCEEGEGRRRKRDWVENVVRSLFAIVYVEEGTKHVRTCHPSVLDFAGGMLKGGLPIAGTVSEGNLAKTFSVGQEEVHSRMFEGCFALMKRDLRFNVCKLDDSFRLNKDVSGLPERVKQGLSEALCYGSLFWLSHLKESSVNVKEGSTKKILGFLVSREALFWVEALSLMDAVDRGIVILQDCTCLYTVRPSPHQHYGVHD